MGETFAHELSHDAEATLLYNLVRKMTTTAVDGVQQI